MNTSVATPPSSLSKPCLLLVDDDPLITETLEFALRQDFEVLTSDTRAHAIGLVRQLPHPPSLALLDLGLPPLPHHPDEGFQLITELLNHNSNMKIIVLSGQSEEVHARHARTLGAIEFIAKPCEPQILKTILLSALQSQAIESCMSNNMANLGGLIGESMVMQKLREQIKQFSDSPFPVLIQGESGSGKELVASRLHHLSTRKDKPFFALNCAAISPTLVEPTLFGYSKGAFTGALTHKSGYFEDTATGSLFLDEIGELPLELQAKLLRVLENGEYQRVGETQKRISQARVITATNRDLRQEVRRGNFRADLYHRLSVFSIFVPPLREMISDKLLLLEYFRDFYVAQLKRPAFELDKQALALWQDYSFPGNVRELRNIVIRLITKMPGQIVTADALADELDLAGEKQITNFDIPDFDISNDSKKFSELAKKHLQKQTKFSLNETLRLWEQAYIEAAMKLTQGNVSQAAKLLGMNRTTLYSRMEAVNKGEEIDDVS